MSDAEGSRRHFPGPPDENTFRILISTDNHVGYAENDPIRREDSFRTLEEIFKIAKDNDVDFVLMGGDLYHYNTPSRYTLWRVGNIFKKYCLGESRITFQVSEDSLVLFPDGQLNYHDPSMSISLPVFAIHGNHDDPSGTPALSAIDLLHQSRVLNYFGKFATADEVVVQPLKLQKGSTHLCIYGFGNIRDERLRQTIDQRRLTWVESDLNDSVNIALVHQNRYNRGHANNYMPEDAFPDFLHAIVWCHEHESILQHGISTNGAPIIQPGSSVATSLSDSEVPEKHVAILEIRGNADHIPVTMVALRTVRPFELQDISLSENGLPPGDKCTEQQVMEVVENAIEKLIVNANNAYAAREPPGPLELSDAILNEAQNALTATSSTGTALTAGSFGASGLAPTGSSASAAVYGMRDGKPLPLIRVRVDASGGYPKPASIKFAPKFQGRVANPESLVTYIRKSTSRTSTSTGEVVEQKSAEEKYGQLSGDDERAIFSLIHEELAKMGGLQALSERFMADSLRDFAEKGAHTILTSLKTYGEQLSDFVHSLTSPLEIFVPKGPDSCKPYELIGRFQSVDDETIRKVSKAFAESHEQGGNVAVPVLSPPLERIDPTPAMLAVGIPPTVPLTLNRPESESAMSDSGVKRKQPTTSRADTAKASKPVKVKQDLTKSKSIPAGIVKGTSSLQLEPTPIPSLSPSPLANENLQCSSLVTAAAPAPTLNMVPAPGYPIAPAPPSNHGDGDNGDDEIVIEKIIPARPARSSLLFSAPAPMASLAQVLNANRPGSQVPQARAGGDLMTDILDEGEGGESLLAQLDEQAAKRIQMYRATGCGHDSGEGHQCGHSGSYSKAKFMEDKVFLQQQVRGASKPKALLTSSTRAPTRNHPSIISSQQPNLLLMPTQMTRATQDVDEL